MNELIRGGIAGVLIGCIVVGSGCQDFGTGGTGEIVIPKPVLRSADPLDLSSHAVTQPTTEATTQPTSQPAQMTLTLDQVREMALKNNLDIRVLLFDPTISKTSISENRAQFEALFTADLNYSTTDTPTSSELSGSSVKDLQIRPGLTIPLITGGNVVISVPTDRFETDNQFSTLNPAYTSDVDTSLSLPLLRGAGIQTNSHAIRLAFYDYQISQARTKLEVIRVLAEAERTYWRLYAARQELQVRKKEYDLAVAQLDRARRMVERGASAEVEIIRAESGVADRVEAIINADNAVRDRQRELKRVLNMPGLEMETTTELVPGTLPRPIAYKLDPVAMSRVAVDKRMEMLELALQIAQENSSVAFAQNGMLPLATLEYTYGINGLGPTYEDSFQLVKDHDFQNHQVGLHVEIPIGNEAARSRLRRALATRLQTMTTRQQRTLAIEQEVYNAIDALQANWQRILASQKRVILNARLLDAETRQFERQLRTSTDVLDAQTSLADAQTDEISAITDYQIAQIDLAFATGMLLGESNVSWSPMKTPKG